MKIAEKGQTLKIPESAQISKSPKAAGCYPGSEASPATKQAKTPIVPRPRSAGEEELCGLPCAVW